MWPWPLSKILKSHCVYSLIFQNLINQGDPILSEGQYHCSDFGVARQQCSNDSLIQRPVDPGDKGFASDEKSCDIKKKKSA